MIRKTVLPELLAPAGDFKCLVAAADGGADAIYVGGKRFGARAFAKNFDLDEIREAVIYCHLRGIRLYVTINTLISDKEMREALDYAKELARVGVDAVIAADIGFIRRLSAEAPEIEIHGSTQMGIHNSEGVRFAHSLGMDRVVLARECSLADIENICKNSAARCEVFLHGALCVCHSGQCLFSSLVGGRSGNRGECAQPCRLPFDGGYPLSLKDLSLASHVKALVASGVDSLKIEGRMKSPEYVYTVTKIYRRLLDENRDAGRDENEELRRAFSRDGFTDGYFVGDKFGKMTGIRREEDKSLSKEIKYSPEEVAKPKLDIDGRFSLGEAARLTVKTKIFDRLKGTGAVVSADVCGAVCREAITAPLTKENISERLSKLGTTPFAPGNISISLSSGVNLSPGEINALRRDGAEAVSEKLLMPLDKIFGNKEDKRDRTPLPVLKKEKMPLKLTTALFLRGEVYSALREKGDLPDIDIAFLPYEYLLDSGESLCCGVGVYIPPVISEGEFEEVREGLLKLSGRGVRYALLGNVSHLSLAEELGFLCIGDFRLNIYNSDTKSLYSSVGLSSFVLSPELTLPMARDIGGGIITFGRIPLMLTERCFIKENFGCGKCNRAVISDRKGAKFPIMREFGHRNLIFNSAKTYMGDRKRELADFGLYHSHLILSSEDVGEAKRDLAAYFKGEELRTAVRRVGRRS